MPLSDGNRRLLLGIVLVASVAAAIAVSRNQDNMPEVITANKDNRMNTAAYAKTSSDDKTPVALDLAVLETRKAAEGSEEELELKTDLFASTSWYVPPPPEPYKAIAPPVPVAPVLPFTYMGTMEDNGHLLVYLAAGEKAYSVGTGDIIQDLYKVESIDEQQIVFMYLPLSIKQILKIGI